MSDFYVILGSRKYDDERVRYPIARDYRYLNAGGGKRYWQPLRHLCPGDRVFAFVGRAGYVGIATVTGQMVPAREARVNGGGLLVDQSDVDAGFKERARRYDDTTEMVVSVEWAKIVPLDDAVPVAGSLFSSPNTACELKADNPKHRQTIEAVERAFEISAR